AKGNTHQQSTYWTQSQGRVSKALERIRRLVPLPTRGRSRMRESRTYGSGRGAGDETHVPTATQLSSCRREIPDRLGRVKAGGSRPRARRGYGLDWAQSISATPTERSSHCADC